MSWFSGWGPRVIRYEQAVYGSAAAQGRGYGLLGYSAGCRREWLTAFETFCRGFGEPRGHLGAARSLACLRLPRRAWMVVLVEHGCRDDQGRPVLRFHGLFVPRREFARAAFDPFALESVAGVGCEGNIPAPLPAGSLECAELGEAPAGQAGGQGAEITSLVHALQAGQRVVLTRDGPIDDLARQVWRRLPRAVRQRRSLATWLYRDHQAIDLVAVPAASGLFAPPGAASSGPVGGGFSADSRRSGRTDHFQKWGLAALVGVLVATAILVRVLRPRHPASTIAVNRPADRVAAVARPVETTASIAPPMVGSLARPGAADRAAFVAALLDLADRCGAEVPPAQRADPTALLQAIRDRLRYQGPWLTHEELASIQAMDGPDAIRAAAWHQHMVRFDGSRELPADFERLPLERQATFLAWSLGVDLPPGLPAREVPHWMADDLAAPPAPPSWDLRARFPALDAYAAFRTHLPAR